MAQNKKKELIQKTYELLKTNSPQEITARTIAAACDCSSTTIYKHFDNLEHLILFSSIKFLEDYIIELNEIIQENDNAVKMTIEMWEVFAKYAFENVEVFELLFWGKYREGLGDAIFEYYQFFPNNLKSLNGFFTSVYFNDNLEERTSIMMQRAATTGYILYDDIKLLSELQCDSFHGLLVNYKEYYREPEKSKEGAQLYMNMLNSLLDHYLIKKIE